MGRKVVIRDHNLSHIGRPNVDVMGFNNYYEALGFVEMAGQRHRADIMIQDNVRELEGKPPIPGHIAIEDGGEVLFREFNSYYEAIGFIVVHFQERYMQTIKMGITEMQPDKFGQHLVAIKKEGELSSETWKKIKATRPEQPPNIPEAPK